jgi:hypothetical protein
MPGDNKKKKVIIPSEKDIKKSLRKISKKRKEEKSFISRSFSSKLFGIVVNMMLIFFILLGVLSMEFIWDSTGIIEPPDNGRRFLMKSCKLSKYSCSADIHEDFVIIDFKMKGVDIDSVSSDICTNSEIRVNNSIVFSDCRFSSLHNSFDIDVEYSSSSSGLGYSDTLSVRTFYELTTFGHMVSSTKGVIGYSVIDAIRKDDINDSNEI